MVVIIIVQAAQSLRYRSGDYAGNGSRRLFMIAPRLVTANEMSETERFERHGLFVKADY